ncbi:MAG: HAMP domain-containing sensor histidine kinase [Clostridia bacterium]|nr:HAMP domain-containing sensor histidine kinase [Clostridia bacterium]
MKIFDLKNLNRAKDTVAARWTKMLVILMSFTLIFLIPSFLIVIHQYFYNTVEIKLSSMYTDDVAGFFSSYNLNSTQAFNEAAEKYISGIKQHTKDDGIEVQVIDKQGKIIASSTGFLLTEEASSDYKNAVVSDLGKSKFVGKNENGEKIMSLTFALPKYAGTETGAIKYITSMKQVDKSVVIVSLIGLTIINIIFLLFLFVGTYFINPISKKIQQINKAARLMAQGDYSYKIDGSVYDDEVEELTDSFNYMAAELERSQSAQNEFLSTVSHEMKTPLTAIKGWSETLLETDSNDRETIQTGLKVIETEASRLQNSVEDLLMLSRMAAGRYEVKKTKMDILAELDETVFLFKDRARKEGINLNYTSPDYAATFFGDPDRIKQVFINILDNAIKYTEAGGDINITTKLIYLSYDVTDELQIFISDTGCGIDENDIDKVREKFYKSNNNKPGSGIGLAVCEELLNLHGAKMEIESKAGEGTTVKLIFSIEKTNIQNNGEINE